MFKTRSWHTARAVREEQPGLPVSAARLHCSLRQTTPPALSLLMAPTPSSALREAADLHWLSRLSIACFLFVHPGVNAFTSKALSLGTAPNVSDNSLSCKHINLGMVARETKSLLPLSDFPECLLEVQRIPPCLCRKCTKCGLIYETRHRREGCIL